MKSSAAFLLVVSAGLFSCSSPPRAESTKSTAEAIQGGSVDTSDAFAVAVMTNDGLCSGTLIAPNLVLTARHCVESSLGAGGNCENGTVFTDPSVLSVVVTNSIQQGGGATPYTVASIHPGPDVSTGCSPDISIVELADSIPSSVATPVRPAVEPADIAKAHFSSKVTAIGFGLDDQGNPGTRHIKENLPILCAGDDTSFTCADGQTADYQVEAAPGPCEGDSGGGLYDQASYDAKAPVVVATVVGGSQDQSTGACGNGVYTRVDKFASFIIATAISAAKTGGYDAPVWAVPSSAIPDAGTDDASIPTSDDDDAGAPASGTPKATTTTTTTSGCSISHGADSENALGFALGLVGLVAIARRRRITE